MEVVVLARMPMEDGMLEAEEDIFPKVVITKVVEEAMEMVGRMEEFLAMEVVAVVAVMELLQTNIVKAAEEFV